MSEDDSDDWATEDGEEMPDAEVAAGEEEEGEPAAAALGGEGPNCEDGSDNRATDDVEEMQDFVVVRRAKRKKLSQQQ